jgi:hypothetical protein
MWILKQVQNDTLTYIMFIFKLLSRMDSTPLRFAHHERPNMEHVGSSSVVTAVALEYLKKYSKLLEAQLSARAQ